MFGWIKNICDRVADAVKKSSRIITGTKHTGFEHGAAICDNGGNIELSDICVGDECKIQAGELTKAKCKRGDRIGFIHTHPSGTLDMSHNDVKFSMMYGDKVACIGNPEGEIKCYDLESHTLYNMGVGDAVEGKSCLDSIRKKYGIPDGEVIPRSKITSAHDWNMAKYCYELLQHGLTYAGDVWWDIGTSAIKTCRKKLKLR